MPHAGAEVPDSSAIIQYLSQGIDWYRQLNREHQIASDPSDFLVVNDDRQLADQIMRLAFDFARAAAQNAGKQGSTAQSDAQNGPASQYQSLLQLSAKLDGQVRDLQSELESLRRKLETASGRQRQLLQSTIPEVQSELDLANARRDAIRGMTEFVSGASTSGLGATGLRAQIEALARSLPPETTQTTGDTEKAGALNSASPASATGPKPEPSGIWGLTAELFDLSGKIRTLDQRMQSTDSLTQKAKQFRAPLLSSLKQLTQQGDTLAKQADTADPTALVQMKKDLDALTAQFRQTSAAVLPLSKQTVLLGLYKTNLTNWQGTVKTRYRAALRSLLLRLVILGLAIAFVFGVSEMWRRTILRYVHDPKRRYQFLLLRKIVFWFVIIIVVAFAFASQLGSVATFAGLLTAGVAVALQNVILSIAGYFFLIGRFGIRVGDRVQIAGVTGEVVDIGLVRLHLMELAGGAETPTGRVVAFSNSIVFQPTAGVFKQIPGTSFVWHEITLTLAADSDYHMVEKRLLGVVEAVFEDYRDDMEKQRQQMERTLSYTQTSVLRPKSRLRITRDGLEAVIRFPVTLQNATEIDDRVTRELLKAIDREPKLKLVGSSVRLNTDVVPPNATT
ncbi:MAG TPA: mechanosensitive ion channel domain-containing protein [Terriglobales bacterium]|nr:mechanosensitive ion channel domain-containing protein [Terriglobales bacterium]